MCKELGVVIISDEIHSVRWGPTLLNHTCAPSRGHALAPFPRVVVSCRVRLGMVPCWIVGHASQDLCLWGHKHVPMALACAAVGYNEVR